MSDQPYLRAVSSAEAAAAAEEAERTGITKPRQTGRSVAS